MFSDQPLNVSDLYIILYPIIGIDLSIVLPGNDIERNDKAMQKPTSEGMRF